MQVRWRRQHFPETQQGRAERRVRGGTGAMGSESLSGFSGAISLTPLGHFARLAPALGCRRDHRECELDQSVNQCDEGEKRDDREYACHSSRKRSSHHFVSRRQHKDGGHDTDYGGFADRHSVIDMGMYFVRLLNSSRRFSHHRSGLRLETCYQNQSIMLRAGAGFKQRALFSQPQSPNMCRRAAINALSQVGVSCRHTGACESPAPSASSHHNR